MDNQTGGKDAVPTDKPGKRTAELPQTRPQVVDLKGSKPNDALTARQMKFGTPWDEKPRCLDLPAVQSRIDRNNEIRPAILGSEPRPAWPSEDALDDLQNRERQQARGGVTA